MQTYNPNNNPGNQTDNYQNNYNYNNSQYNADPGNYYNAGNTSYDANYNYGNQYNNGGQQYNYNSQYEYGDQYGYNNQYGVSGMQGFKTLVAEEVIAKSFLFMVVALIITAVASLTTPPAVSNNILTSRSLFYMLLFAEFGVALVSNWVLSKNNAILGGVLFAVYSYLTGVTCSVLFFAFTGSSIAVIFIVTAVLFGIMAVIGLVTKKDLTSAGNILLMGLIGIILTSTTNLIFLKSDMADTVICSVGVLIFVGLVAYDAQKIKSRVTMSDDSNVLSFALLGAFDLYLDFINIFLKLLRLFGKRK